MRSTLLHIKVNYRLPLRGPAPAGLKVEIHFITDLKFLRSWGSLWKQCEKISDLWLMLAPSGLHMMKYFSVRHKLHFPFPGLKGLAQAMGVHLVSCKACNLPSSPSQKEVQQVNQRQSSVYCIIML